MKPLILDYQVRRLEEAELVSYHYDTELSLNVICINGTNKPFIEISTSDIELMTKTKVKHESDDDAIRVFGNTDLVAEPRQNKILLELSTKTFVAQERDDERKDYLLELATKTRVKSESDDENFNYN